MLVADDIGRGRFEVSCDLWISFSAGRTGPGSSRVLRQLLLGSHLPIFPAVGESSPLRHSPARNSAFGLDQRQLKEQVQCWEFLDCRKDEQRQSEQDEQVGSWEGKVQQDGTLQEVRTCGEKGV